MIIFFCHLRSQDTRHPPPKKKFKKTQKENYQKTHKAYPRKKILVEELILEKDFTISQPVVKNITDWHYKDNTKEWRHRDTKTSSIQSCVTNKYTACNSSSQYTDLFCLTFLPSHLHLTVIKLHHGTSPVPEKACTRWCWRDCSDFFVHIHTTKATAPKGNRFPAHPCIIPSLHLQDLNERHDTSPYQQNISFFVIHLFEELVCLNNAEVNIMVLNNSR